MNQIRTLFPCYRLREVEQGFIGFKEEVNPCYATLNILGLYTSLLVLLTDIEGFLNS